MRNGKRSMVMSGKRMTTGDHVMVGVTSIGLFVCYKMMLTNPVFATLLVWFNIRMFERYCMRRKNG